MLTKHPQGFLAWQAPGRIPSVQLDFGVIDRMNVEMMRSFAVTRRRGTEIGGVLLGKIVAGDEPTVFIYDYETVPCEYSAGPSYVLSARDSEVFREIAGRWSAAVSPDQYVVGYFRSHTREDLSLDEIDVRQFHEHIYNTFAVALVVKPYATKVAEAAFFLQTGGKLDAADSPAVFGFARSAEPLPESNAPIVSPARSRPMPAQHSGEPRKAEVEAAKTQEPARAPEPAAPARRPRQVHHEPPEQSERPQPAIREQVRAAPPIFSTYYPVPLPTWKTRTLWVALALAIFGFGGVAGYQYAGGPMPWAQGSARGGGPPNPGIGVYSINLSATPQGENVLVKWDRDSGAVKAAQGGVLTITEGGVSKDVKLDLPELRNGTVLYHRAGEEIGFKLELFLKGSVTMTETVTLRLGQPGATQ